MEVKIRTMKSDIASMKQSGGGTPTFQDVPVKGLSLEKEYKTPDFSPTPMPAAATVQPAAQPVQAPAKPAPVSPTPAVALAQGAPSTQVQVQAQPASSRSSTPSEREVKPETPVVQSLSPLGKEPQKAASVTNKKGSNIGPILIVIVVAVFAVAVVGYFAYTIFK